MEYSITVKGHIAQITSDFRGVICFHLKDFEKCGLNRSTAIGEILAANSIAIAQLATELDCDTDGEFAGGMIRSLNAMFSLRKPAGPALPNTQENAALLGNDEEYGEIPF